MRDVVDFETAPDPALLTQLGLGAAPYTGNARPDPTWFAAARARGVGPDWMIQESYSTRSTEGYAVGAADCQYAEQRAREVGHTGPIAVAASDGNSADRWDASSYAHGWSDTATLPFFPYGAHGVLDSFCAGALAGNGAHLLVPGADGQPGRWVPETWGATNLVGQVVGPSPVPDSDLNHVHVDISATPAPTPNVQEDDDMVIIISPSDSFAIQGNLIFRNFTGDRAFAGIPADVAPFLKANPGTPIRVVTDAETLLMHKASDALTNPPAAGPGGSIDPKQFAADVAAHLQLTSK